MFPHTGEIVTSLLLVQVETQSTAFMYKRNLELSRLKKAGLRDYSTELEYQNIYNATIWNEHVFSMQDNALTHFLSNEKHWDFQICVLCF